MSRSQGDLALLKAEITERKEYLRQINSDIDLATENGAAALCDLKIEVDGLETKKARLMKELLVIQQQIQIAKSTR